MIIWLYNLLHKRNNSLRSLGSRWGKNFSVIVILLVILRGLGNISTKLLIFLIIPLLISYSGLLNKPYAYLINRYNLEIKRKIFKDKIYIQNKGERMFSLIKERFNVKGIVIENSIYIDKKYDKDYEESLSFSNHYFILWGMKKRYNINYVKGIAEFLYKEINDKDDLTIIKRKIMLNNLMN